MHQLKGDFSSRRWKGGDFHSAEAKPDLIHTESGSETEYGDHQVNDLAVIHEERVPRKFFPTASSPPGSPKRPSRKEKKVMFRTVLGIDGSSLGPLNNVIQEETPEETWHMIFLHYFWCSRLFLVVYGIIVFSILSNEPLILHGITIAILGFMFRQALAWVCFLAESRETRSAIKHLKWMTRFSFKNVQKVAEGDRMRGFLATKTFNFWTGSTGKGFALSYLRKQSHDIRQRKLQEAKNALDESTRTFQNMAGPPWRRS